MNEPDLADHAFLDGRLILREPRRGHRSGTDAVLLAAAARLETGQHLFDIGAGAGAVALAVLCRVADATATLVESDPGMAHLARHNIAANGFEGRATVVQADIFDVPTCRMRLPRDADVVVSNPPFYLAKQVRASTIPQRVHAHVLERGDHGDWLRRILSFAHPQGRVVMIHRPDALPALIRAAEGRAALRLRCIHSVQDRAAGRVIVEAAPGRKTPFAVDPPLVLHDATGAFTPLAEALHRGRCWM